MEEHLYAFRIVPGNAKKLSDGKKVKERKGEGQGKSTEESMQKQGRENRRVGERSNSWNVEKNINYTYAIKTNITHLAFYRSYSDQIIKPNH